LDACCDQTVSRFSVFLQNNQTGAGIAYSLIDGPGFEFRQGKLFFSSPKRPNWVWDPLSLLDSGYECSVLGIKRPGSDVDNSPPSSTEVNNEWIYICMPLSFGQRQICPLLKNNIFLIISASSFKVTSWYLSAYDAVSVDDWMNLGVLDP
jgi:hypothetical protein